MREEWCIRIFEDGIFFFSFVFNGWKGINRGMKSIVRNSANLGNVERFLSFTNYSNAILSFYFNIISSFLLSTQCYSPRKLYLKINMETSRKIEINHFLPFQLSALTYILSIRYLFFNKDS